MDRGQNQLGGGGAEGKGQTEPDRHPHHPAKEQGEGQKAHNALEQAVAVVDQGVLPGVHPHQDDGVVLVPGGVEQVGVDKHADDGEQQQDVEIQVLRHRRVIQRGGPPDHGGQIEQLEAEGGHNLPQDGQHVGEDFQPPDLVQQIRQQPLDQGNLLQGIEDAVDPVGVLQGEGDPECLIHVRPPAALR